MRITAATLATLLAAVSAAAGGAGEPAQERADMVRVIERHAATVPDILDGGSLAPAVLAAMREVPRHLFIAEEYRHMAHADRPVPIGYGQTISQPFIVALMTHLVEPDPGDVVLEIGTGSGYQAAVLSPLVGRVCTIEIIPPLAEGAAARLDELGYRNVQVRVADGYHGWPECGPFDGIVVTAAIDHVPPPLVGQLRPGGRMVIPVGGAFAVQYLTLVEKDAAGGVGARQLLPVRFVPFVRGGP
jgi:protein-L-isoaspartate(D-aspartate) O-methyltransferase